LDFRKEPKLIKITRPDFRVERHENKWYNKKAALNET
jgi:hypothetical protein